MAGYNGSGTFVRLYNWVTDKGNSVKVTASRMDGEDDGFATGLSNVICKDGQTTTTAAVPFAGGPVKLQDGTAAAPAVSSINDTDCGFYRIGTNNWGLSMAGSKVWDYGTATASVAGSLAIGGTLAVTGAVDLTATASCATLNVTSTANVGTFIASAMAAATINLAVPAGVIVPYAGSSAPTGWLLCNGASLVRATYAALFTAIGTTFGAADGTHFSVPDLGGRTIAGKEASATRLTSAVSGVDGGTLGAAGGTQSHVLSSGEMPSHTHTGTTGNDNANHSHDTGVTPTGNGFTVGGTTAPAAGTNNTGTQSAAHQHAFTTDATGSGTAHTITQPTMILNYIIKT